MNYNEMQQTIDLITKVMNEANDVNRQDAWAMDKKEGKDAFYVDYDDSVGGYCVFGTESGFAYDSCGDKDEAQERMEELRTQLEEDMLVSKEEKLYGDDEEVEDEEGLSEDYSEGQYGVSREEIIANIAMKYLGVTKESFGFVEVDVENVWTALNDAFEGGCDLSGQGSNEGTEGAYDGDTPDVDIEVELEIEAKLKETKLSESSDVKGSVKMGDGSRWDYIIDGDTGELSISTVFKEVPATTTIISEEVHGKLQEILFSDDMDMPEKMGKLEELKAEVALTVREFFNQSTITAHVTDTVTEVLDAYSGSLSMQIDENIRKRM